MNSDPDDIYQIGVGSHEFELDPEELMTDRLEDVRDTVYEEIADLIVKHEKIGELPDEYNIGKWEENYDFKRNEASVSVDSLSDARTLERNGWTLSNYEMETASENEGPKIILEDSTNRDRPGRKEYVKISVEMSDPQIMEPQDQEIRLFEDIQDKRNNIV